MRNQVHVIHILLLWSWEIQCLFLHSAQNERRCERFASKLLCQLVTGEHIWFEKRDKDLTSLCTRLRDAFWDNSIIFTLQPVGICCHFCSPSPDWVSNLCFFQLVTVGYLWNSSLPYEQASARANTSFSMAVLFADTSQLEQGVEIKEMEGVWSFEDGLFIRIEWRLSSLNALPLLVIVIVSCGQGFSSFQKLYMPCENGRKRVVPCPGSGEGSF